MGEREKRAGRPRRLDEPVVKRHFDLPQSLNEKLVRDGRPAVDVVRRALEREFDGGEPSLRDSVREAVAEALAQAGFTGLVSRGEAVQEARVFSVQPSQASPVAVPMLAHAPCGPWQEAIAQAEVVRLSPETLEFLGWREGDVFVRAVGESMAGAGIPDGALVLFRPLHGGRPTWGEVALVQVFTRDGGCVSTIKAWHETSSGVVDLRDGRGLPYALPADVERVEAVAVKRGIIAAG